MENETEKQRQMEYIYIHYHKLMLKVAYNIVKNREDAQDVVQQALLQLMSNPSEIENTVEKRLRSYVLTTVHNCAIDLLRKQSRLQSSLLFFQEACILDQTLPMIHICLENLPENYRDPFAGSDNHSGAAQKRLGGMRSDTPLKDETDFIERVRKGVMETFSLETE